MQLAPVTKRDLKALLPLLKACDPGAGALDEKALARQVLEDPDFDPSFCVQGLEKGKPAAYALGVARRGTQGKLGYVKSFGVAPAFQGCGLGQELFGELERRFQKREARAVNVGACPAPSLATGVDCLQTATVAFLLRRGYLRQGDSIVMRADLAKAPLKPGPEQEALAKACKARRASKAEDLEKVMALARVEFPQWLWEVRAAAKDGSLFLAEQGGQAVAFACASLGEAQALGPLGTCAAERGKGLGRLMLRLALLHLKARKQMKPRIDHASDVHFFARHAAASIESVRWHFMKRV